MSSPIPTQEYAIPSSSIDQQTTIIKQQGSHGHITGVELPVTDLFRAQTFYEVVFNWEFYHYGESNVIRFRSGSVTGIVLQVEERNHYTLAHDHSQGVITSKSGKRTTSRSVGFTIQVADLGRTLGEVENAGGKIWLGEQEFRDDAPGRDGYYAYILDTEDNVIGLRSIDAA